MDRHTKRFLWSFAITAVVCALLFLATYAGLLTPHHTRAKDPAHIEDVVDVPLPHICRSLSSNNLDRGTSCWDCYIHTAYFSEPLKRQTIDHLEALCKSDSCYWSKNTTEQCYVYNDDAWNEGGVYSVCCAIYTDHATMEYYVDEVMRTVPHIVISLVMIIAAVVMLYWGLTLIIIKGDFTYNQ